MSYPQNLKYTRDHEWIVSKEAGSALIGVTAYAIEQLGDIVHIDLPKVGDKFAASAPFGTIESTKTVSDLYSPVTGTITAINEGIKSKLESLATDPYDQGWLVKVSLTNPAEMDGLLSAADYQKFIAE
jgi:glycine cleavage system H protein